MASSKWYAEHREEAQAKQRAYYAANKERLAAQAAGRRNRYLATVEGRLEAGEVVTKQCTKCGETKPITEFYRDSSRDDAFRPSCKDCHKTLVYGRKQDRTYRRVAADALGRPLNGRETVHHVNGDATDNRPDNLWVCTISGHGRAHASLLRVLKPLLEQGVILFDRGAGVYRLADSG